MKKTGILSICIFIVAFVLLLTSGCSKQDKIDSISIKDYDPNTVIEIMNGEFNYGAYTLIVTYDSGKTEEVALNEDMILDADIVKFYQVGDHDVTVSYGEKTCGFKISVKRGTLENIKFSENNVFTYDGKAHTVELEGDIPANAVITYPGGNSFTNAGTYNVTAVVTCEGYVTGKATTTVTIERAKYDMSGIKFESKEVSYDGKSHSLEIEGELPEGVSGPTYYINGNKLSSAIDVGEYKVVATFATNNMNYEAIPNMEATLKITSSEYNVDGLDIAFKNHNGSVIDGLQKIYDAESITVDINDRKILPVGTQISFKIADSEGNEVTVIKDVGVYEVKAEFIVPDNKNHKDIQPIVRHFEVKKAKYDIENIHFDSEIWVYDEKNHSIFLSFPDDFDTDEVDVRYEYYLGKDLLLDGEGKPLTSVINAGEYTVKAIFTVKNKNYEQIAPMQAMLEIKKSEIDIASFYYDDERSFIWDGNPHKVSFYGWDIEGLEYEIVLYKHTPDAEMEWTELKAGDSGVFESDGILSVVVEGRYKREITVINNSGNYVLSTGDSTKTFICEFIIQKEIDVEGIYITSDKEGEGDNESFNEEFTSGIFKNGSAHTVGVYLPDTVNTEVLICNCSLYRLNESNTWERYESQTPEEIKVMNLAPGSYKYIVEVRVKESLEYHVLSVGERSMELVYEFYVES